MGYFDISGEEELFQLLDPHVRILVGLDNKSKIKRASRKRWKVV